MYEYCYPVMLYVLPRNFCPASLLRTRGLAVISDRMPVRQKTLLLSYIVNEDGCITCSHRYATAMPDKRGEWVVCLIDGWCGAIGRPET